MGYNVKAHITKKMCYKSKMVRNKSKHNIPINYKYKILLTCLKKYYYYYYLLRTAEFLPCFVVFNWLIVYSCGLQVFRVYILP